MLVESKERLGDASRPHVESSTDRDADWQFLRLASEPSVASTCAGKITVADLFSGCGGLSLGVKVACSELHLAFEANFAVDSSTSALETYRKNFSPVYFSDDPLEKLVDGGLGQPTTSAENELLEKINSPTILLAGPPCQGHSSLNNHTRHSDTRNALYERVARFAELTLPDHAIVENVPDVRHADNDPVQRTKDHLVALGYECDDAVVNLADIGIPQKRRRHVLVASRIRSIREGKYLSNLLSANKIAIRRSVAWAIQDLEEIALDGLFDTSSKLSPTNMERASYLITNDKLDLPNRLRPKCHQNETHSYKSMYGRLDYGSPAQTITTGFGSPGQGRYIHPSKCRTITPHEAARLQFFPDYFDFSSVQRRGDLARVIGNAVPMKLARIISQDLLKTAHE